MKFIEIENKTLLRKLIMVFTLFLCFNSFSQLIPNELRELNDYLESVPYVEKFKILDEAISNDPNQPWYYWMYAQAYSMKNEKQKAQEYFEKAITIDPNFSGGHASYARFIYNYDTTNLEKALFHINKAIQLEPVVGYYHIDRGEIYFLLKQYDQALDDANYELTLNDSDPNSSYQLIVKILHSQNKKKELYEYLIKHDLSKLGAFDTDFGILVGNLYDEMGDSDKACICYRTVAEPYEIMEIKMPVDLKQKLKKCKK